MFLPNQAPPVERSLVPQQAPTSGDIHAQATCYCRTVNGVSTWWCIVDRYFVDSKVPCTP